MAWVTRRVERRVSSERRHLFDRRQGVAVRLTKREQEIRDLITAGLGNKDIARQLSISTNTVKSHVHNMLGKLAALTPTLPPLRPSPTDGRWDNHGRRATSRRSYRFRR